MVEVLASPESSAPPLSHTNGMTWCTRSYAFLPGAPNGLMSGTLSLIACSVALKESRSLNAVAGSTPAFSSTSLR